MTESYRCNTCGFRVPADEIGVTLMLEHLRGCDPSQTDSNSHASALTTSAHSMPPASSETPHAKGPSTP